MFYKNNFAKNLPLHCTATLINHHRFCSNLMALILSKDYDDLNCWSAE